MTKVAARDRAQLVVIAYAYGLAGTLGLISSAVRGLFDDTRISV